MSENTGDNRVELVAPLFPPSYTTRDKTVYTRDDAMKVLVQPCHVDEVLTQPGYSRPAPASPRTRNTGE